MESFDEQQNARSMSPTNLDTDQKSDLNQANETHASPDNVSKHDAEHILKGGSLQIRSVVTSTTRVEMSMSTF